MGPRFSGKVCEEPQRREGKRGEKLRNQDFCIRVTKTNRDDEEERGVNPQPSGHSSPNILLEYYTPSNREIRLSFQYSPP